MADPVDIPLAQLLAEVKAGTRITFATPRRAGRICAFMRAWFVGVNDGRFFPCTSFDHLDRAIADDVAVAYRHGQEFGVVVAYLGWR